MKVSKFRKAIAAVFVVALAALLAGGVVACDKETPVLTVNAEMTVVYGNTPSQWRITLEGAKDGESAQSLGIEHSVSLPSVSQISSLDAGTYTYDVDVSRASAKGYQLKGGTATLVVKPRTLTVEVGSQSMTYSPDGVRPYTDGTQAEVEGLLEGHRIEIGLSADCDPVPNAGTVADIIWDGTVKVFDGDKDVSGNYKAQVTVAEDAVMTVAKAKAEVVAVAEVDYDGKPHSFADSGYTVTLSEGCDQEYTVSDADATYTQGGIYAAAVVTLPETTNYVGQTVEGLLKIKSVKVGDTTYALEDALVSAESGDTIIVCNDTVFSTAETYSAQEYRTVKEGVTLLLPFNSSYSASIVELWADRGANKTVPEPYVTLYIPSGLEVSVQGTFTVNARRTANNTNMMGMAYDNALLDIAKDACVVVYDGGTFNSVGFTTGDGTLTVRSGGTVAETMVLTGYRGGTISQNIYEEVFPFNQYMLNNIEVKSVYEAGSQLFAKAAVFGNVPYIGSCFGISEDIKFVGGEDAMINVWSGSLIKEFNPANGVTKLTVEADCRLNNLELNVKGVSLTLNSAGQEIPFPGNFDIVVNSGNVTLDGVGIKLLPGCDFTVEDGATVNLINGAKIFAYNNKDFGWSQDGITGYPVANTVQCYRIAPTLDYNIKTESVLTVNGKMIVDATSVVAGFISTTEGGEISFASDAKELAIKEFASNASGYTYFTMTGTADLGIGNVPEKGVYVSSGGVWKKA